MYVSVLTRVAPIIKAIESCSPACRFRHAPGRLPGQLLPGKYSLDIPLPAQFTVDYSMWEILQKKVYKTRITDLDEPKQQLRMEWSKLDHVVIIAAIRQLCRQ